MRPSTPPSASRAWWKALLLPSGVVTLLRIPVGLVFALVASRAVQLGALVLAASSDVADGALARARGEETRAGAILDPIADKWFAACVVGSLLARGTIDLAVASALLLRDLGLAAAAIALLVGGPRAHGPVRAASLGKVTTVAQFLAVGAIELRLSVASVFVAASAAVGALAAGSYFLREVRARARAKRA